MRYYEIIVESLESEFIPRIQKAIDKKGLSDAWSQTIQSESSEDQAAELLELFKQLDPTERNDYTKWIATVWGRGNLPREDASKVTEYLKLYDGAKKANKLPPEAKDINSLKSISDLYNTVKDLRQEEMKSKKQIKKDEFQDLFDKGEAEVTYSHSKFKVIHVKSERASCILGRGTEWCTAATESDNWFKRYDAEGNLYVIIFRGSSDKYQFHWSNEGNRILQNYIDLLNDKIEIDDEDKSEEDVIGEMRDELNEHGVQFMDEHDEPVDIKELITEHPELLEWPQFEYVALLFSPGSVMTFKDLPKNVITNLIELDGKAIKYIDNPSRPMKRLAIKYVPEAIKFIDNIEDQDVYLWLQKYPALISYYLDILKDKEDQLTNSLKDIMMRVMKSGFTWPEQNTTGMHRAPYTGPSILLTGLLQLGYVDYDEAKEVFKAHPLAFNRVYSRLSVLNREPINLSDLTEWMREYLEDRSDYDWDEENFGVKTTRSR